MKQITMFSDEQEQPTKYARVQGAPIYEPRHAKPHIRETYDDTKARALIEKANAATGITEDERAMLRAAAMRHVVFHYENMADLYAHSSAEMQRLMEESALVIIDIGQAIERGYVNVSSEMRKQYLEEVARRDNNAR